MGCHVVHAAHASPESGKTQSVLWSFVPGPQFFLDIVCFVKSGLVRFVGMSELRVEKSLSQITGAFETLVEAIEAHQRLMLREHDEQLIHMFDERCNPKGSYVFRFGANDF